MQSELIVLSKKIMQNNIILVSYSPPPHGGIATWTEEILAINKRDSRRRIYLLDVSPRWREFSQIEAWRRILGGSLFFLRDFFQFLGIIREKSPTIVHICTPGHLAVFRDVAFLIVARLLNIKSIYHLHFGKILEILQHNNWQRLFLIFAFNLSNKILVLEHSVYCELIKRFPKKQIYLLPNCIRLPDIKEPIKNFESKTLNVIFLGWVIATKGVLELIEVLLELKNLDFNLKIIGPIDQSFLIKLQTIGEKLGPRLSFLGELDHKEAMAHLAKSDFLVLPSHSEGFPIVILEAMSLGKPVIGSDVGAIAEILKIKTDAPCGMVFPPKNTKSLKSALKIMLTDSNLRRIYGRNALINFKNNFTSDLIYKKLVAIWEG